MMKCRTCKHWEYNSKGIGTCNGLSPEYKTVPLPPILDAKGKLQKRSKLLKLRSGVVGINSTILTPPDFYCKNWSRK